MSKAALRMTKLRALIVLFLLAGLSGTAKSQQEKTPEVELQTLRGKVVWLAEALERRYGIHSVPEAAERILALETASGRLHPLLEDKRGRSFRLDPRLRSEQVELLVRVHAKSPMAQVIKIFAIDARENRFELDYWCEICSIAMFELKACDCCQAPIVLRRRPVPPARPQ